MHQVAMRREWGRAVQRLERAGLVAPEAIPGRFAGRAVNADIGDVAGPGFEMGFQRRPAREASAGDGVALHVADAALVLPLRAGPIRAQARIRKPPCFAKACNRGCSTTSRLDGS